MPEADLGSVVRRAFEAIDAVNAADPVGLEVDGEVRPKEVVHAERMTHWVEVLDPDADVAQLIAARAHHLRRWAVPRSTYPDGRAGYLRWRTDQRRRQAEELESLLVSVGCPGDVAQRAMAIVAKKGLGSDPAAQTHEDALCLVFLELQLDELAARLEHDHMVEVVRKSLVKMSPKGIAAAGGVPMSDSGRAVVAEAIAAAAAP